MARRSNEALAIAKPDFGPLIAERAYYRAEKRGFAPGHELEDWLAAEQEVAALTAAEAPVEAAPAKKRAAPKAAKKPSSRKKAATVKKVPSRD